MDSDDLDDAMKGQDEFVRDDGTVFGASVYDTLYYFGNNEDADGAMKTGNVSVTLDGDSYQFQFSTTGGSEGKGRGVNGIDDGKYVYKFGQKLKASSDDKYIVVYASGDIGKSVLNSVHKVNTSTLRSDYSYEMGQNKDGDTVSVVGTLGTAVTNASGNITGFTSNYYLLNISGTIVKNKTAGRDGNDWYFYVDNKVIKMYTNNNTLNNSKDYPNSALVSLKNKWDKTDYEVKSSDTTKKVPANIADDADLNDDGI